MEEMTGEMTAAATFDADRAMLMKRELFRPLAVQSTERLADALTRKKGGSGHAAASAGTGWRGIGPAHTPDDLPPCGAGRVERDTVSCDLLSALL